MKHYFQRNRYYKIAILLSTIMSIASVAALLGFPAIKYEGVPVIGIKGLFIGLTFTAIPWLLILLYEKLKDSSSKQS